MREIIFRGKRLYNGEWVYGWPFADTADCSLKKVGKCGCTHDGSEYFIVEWVDDFHEYEEREVIPDTVGQYTGLEDKNGKKIFEGDIVHILGNQSVADWKSVNYNALIAFLDGGFCAIDGTIEEHAIRRYALARMDFDLEVIGNIHDNPELLKEEAQP